MYFKKKSALIVSSFFTGCIFISSLSGCLPKNIRQIEDDKYSAESQKIGMDKVALCLASSFYYKEKGNNVNYNFGSNFSNIYYTEKWLSAKASHVFYYSLYEKFPKDVIDSKLNQVNNPSNFTKENVQECVNNLNNASTDIKNAVFKEAPFFIDAKPLPFLCSSDTNVNGHRMQGSDTSGVSAVSYHLMGLNPGNYSICSDEESLPINIREIKVIAAFYQGVDYIAKIQGSDGYLYGPLNFKKNPIVENYYPDEAITSNNFTKHESSSNHTHTKKKKK